MDIKQLLQMQTERGAKISGVSERNKTTIQEVISKCRKVLEERSDRYRDLSVDEKKSIIKQIIIDFVMSEKPLVDGYISGDNVPDTIKLTDKLVEAITNYDFLTEAMNDDSVNEIRANGKYIKIEKNGKIMDLQDENGNMLYFHDPEQQEIIMKKMLGDVRCTPAHAICEATTIEGYRMQAIHSSALGVDPKDPYGERYSAFVLRKFKDERPELKDIVKFKTMSDDMARALKIFARGYTTVLTVGPTSSGKTTTNTAFVNAIEDMRVIFIQNPSEIDGRQRDEMGRVTNDVLHLEAHEVTDPKPCDPTAVNLMDASLRLSPRYIVFGEWRTNQEFEYGMKLLLAGHPVNATYHSESVIKAFRRFLTAYTASSGESPELAAQTLADNIDIIVVQRFMNDGSRKVLEIAEITGVDPEQKTKPIVNSLYKFIPGDPTYDEKGKLVSINGTHKRVGCISKALEERFALAGLKKSDYSFLTQDLKLDKEQTYVGEV
jgi:type II secretion system protein E